MRVLITISGGPEIYKNDMAKVMAFAIANQTFNLGGITIIKEWDGDKTTITDYNKRADVVIACKLESFD